MTTKPTADDVPSGRWVVGPRWVAQLAKTDATVFALLDCPPQFPTELEARRELAVQMRGEHDRLCNAITTNMLRLMELEGK